jgi:hypothetical protein
MIHSIPWRDVYERAKSLQFGMEHIWSWIWKLEYEEHQEAVGLLHPLCNPESKGHTLAKFCKAQFVEPLSEISPLLDRHLWYISVFDPRIQLLLNIPLQCLLSLSIILEEPTVRVQAMAWVPLQFCFWCVFVAELECRASIEAVRQTTIEG